MDQPVFPEREPVVTQSEPQPGTSTKHSAEEVSTDETMQPKVKLTRLTNTESPQKTG